LLRERDHSSRHFVRVFASLPANPLPDNTTPAQALEVPRALIMEYCQGSLSELILDRVMYGYTVIITRFHCLITLQSRISYVLLTGGRNIINW
jgi:hypothetical protein